jgi:8-oxo-dGTP diphosphatase
MHDSYPILVHILLWRERRVLLLRRFGTGTFDGWYAPPGGHLVRGESLAACAVRECREETGIAIDEAALRPLAALGFRSAGQQGINMLFECRTFAGTARIAEPERFDDLCWAAPDTLPSRTVPYLAATLARADRGEWFYEFEDEGAE